MRSADCPTPTITGVRGSTVMKTLFSLGAREMEFHAVISLKSQQWLPFRRTVYKLFRISRAIVAVSDGVLPTRTPAASRASFLAAAVPDEPDTIAPAWPIVLPSGAVKPAT